MTCPPTAARQAGIHFAMEYLYERQRAVDAGREHGEICAKDKHVVVIGGGDTGADCVGNAIREGALSVVQLEILRARPNHRPDEKTPWPLWPEKYRLSYAMEEALSAGKGEQDYAVTTTRFIGDGEEGHRGGDRRGRELRAEGRHRARAAGRPRAAGHGLPASRAGLLDKLEIAKDQRGNAKAPTYETDVEGVFAAGDARRGQSLIVWAINEGRQAARMCNRFLGGLRELQTGNTSPQDEGPEGPPTTCPAA